MFTQIYRHLKDNGFDVYSIGQHKGICTNPYIVIKENGESEIAFLSSSIIVGIGSTTLLIPFKSFIVYNIDCLYSFSFE